MSKDAASLPARILAFPLTRLAIGFVAIVLSAVVPGNTGRLIGIDPRGPGFALWALLTALCVILAYKVLKRWLECLPDGELPWCAALGELPAGLLFGFALFSAMVGLVMVLGGMEVLGLRGIGQLWPMLAMAIISGTLEEVLFRGIVQRQLEAMLGTWAALGLTSALFGAAHLANPDATWWSSLAITLEAGLLLGGAWLYTRRLWLPIGLHAAWNFTQGWVFSLPVSGGETPLGLLITRRVGPDWLTGGEFGLEASLPAMLVAAIAGFVLLTAAKRRGGFVPPMWRRHTKL